MSAAGPEGGAGGGPAAAPTAIDRAHAALEAAGEDARLRMAFYGAVLGAELYLLLEAEPQAERVRPLVLETEAGNVVVAFDSPERMAAFLDAPRDYLALAGRALFGMLAGQGIGIALNPEVAPSASVIGPAAVDALARQEAALEAQEARLAGFRQPSTAPAGLVEAIGARIASYGGLVAAGHLVAAEDEAGEERLLLALEGVPEAAEAAVAAAMDEALRFSGAEGVRLDIVFPGEALLARIRPVALAVRPERSERRPPRPPGSDPARPPRLR